MKKPDNFQQPHPTGRLHPSGVGGNRNTCEPSTRRHRSSRLHPAPADPAPSSPGLCRVLVPVTGTRYLKTGSTSLIPGLFYDRAARRLLRRSRGEMVTERRLSNNHGARRKKSRFYTGNCISVPSSRCGDTVGRTPGSDGPQAPTDLSQQREVVHREMGDVPRAEGFPLALLSLCHTL